MRDLFIVARSEPELYEYLTRRFAGRADVEVILDRRVGERRRDTQPATVERRRGRRRARPAAEDDIKSLGFAVVPIPAGGRATGTPPPSA